MFEILDAKIDDIDRIYDLLNKNFTCEKLSKESIRDYVENKTGLDNVKTLYIDGEFLGTVIYRINDIAELITICVDEKARHQHNGEYLIKLMLFTIDTYNMDLKAKCSDIEYKEKSCKKVMLEVRSKNDVAIRLYEKEKFVKLNTRKNYYKDPTDDCVVMERNIVC